MAFADKLCSYYDSVEVTLEPTTYCNLQCPCCPATRCVYPKGNLPQDHFRRFIDDITQNSSRIIHLCGIGEPFCNPAIYEMISYVPRQAALWLSTNGMFRADQRRLELLRKVHGFIVTLDAVTDDVLHRSRPGASVSRILANVEALLELRRMAGATQPLVQLRMNVFSFNKHDIPGMIRTAAELGVDALLIHRGTAPPELTAVVDMREFEPLPAFVRIDPRLCSGTAEQESEAPQRAPIHADHTLFRTLGCGVPYVHWDGLVTCCRDSKGNLPFGNLLESSYNKIFSWGNLDRIAKVIAGFEERFEKEEYIVCDGCPKFFYNRHKLVRDS
ncbi:MAG: radical SAM protein [Thermodesulfobacteriota bacterium]|nr:radical SAM protein [Thermodesulfobacteriota bacterium]